MAGRTNSKWTRVYVDGYDLSGDARSIGPLLHTFDEADLTAFSHGVKGALPTHATLGVGTLNVTMNNTASTGAHNVIATAGGKRTIMVAVGIQAEPAQGDPVYMGEFEQLDYQAEFAGGVYVNAPFGNSSARANTFLYDKPWGVLLRPKTATTAVNSATGVDDYGAATAFGGYMSYHVFAANGTATIKVQDAETNTDGSFADITGCTSGVVDFTNPSYGRVAIGRTAAVRRYLRWQIVLGTASSVTFALGFSRALY